MACYPAVFVFIYVQFSILPVLFVVTCYCLSNVYFIVNIYKSLIQNLLLLSLWSVTLNPYPTAFPYGNGMVLRFYQKQESSTTKTVHKVINKGLKAYV